jgi:hypothetical protein
MSYDLRITFSGLTLFVPQSNDTMHVLLPQSSGHVHAAAGAGTGHPSHNDGGVHGHHDPHGHDADGGATAVLDPPAEPGDPVKEQDADPEEDEEIEVHFTRLIYDTAYENPNAAELSRTYKVLDFTGRTLDLRGLTTTGEGLHPVVPNEIPSMDRVQRHVDPALVQDGALDARLAARLALGSGAITNCLLGARFSLAGQDQRITVRSEWTVRGVTSDEPANGGAGARRAVLPAQPAAGLPVPLYPIGQTIHLMVFNTTAEEFPPHGPGFDVPMPRGDAHHFAAYYPLTVEGPSNAIPRRINDRDVEVEHVGPRIKKQAPQTLLGMTCVQTSGTFAQ